jgi:hypothetical protein
MHQVCTLVWIFFSVYQWIFNRMHFTFELFPWHNLLPTHMNWTVDTYVTYVHGTYVTCKNDLTQTVVKSHRYRNAARLSADGLVNILPIMPQQTWFLPPSRDAWRGTPAIYLTKETTSQEEEGFLWTTDCRNSKLMQWVEIAYIWVHFSDHRGYRKPMDNFLLFSFFLLLTPSAFFSRIALCFEDTWSPKHYPARPSWRPTA